MWWLLAREVLFLRGDIPDTREFKIKKKEKKDGMEIETFELVMPDQFFYRSPDDVKKAEEIEEKQPPPAAIEAPPAEEVLFVERSFLFSKK